MALQRRKTHLAQSVRDFLIYELNGGVLVEVRYFVLKRRHHGHWAKDQVSLHVLMVAFLHT